MHHRLKINPDLLYVIPKEDHDFENIQKKLSQHPEIRFVSFVGIDLSGNDTDEKIPASLFIDNIDEYLNGAVQTDGSSVVLPGIATLNDGKVDFIADLNVNWFVDYNYENLYHGSDLPVGTLRIPSYLVHNGLEVCSRSVLKRAVEGFNREMLNILENNPEVCSQLGIDSGDISDISLTAATELEFWVRTPDEKIVVEQLSVSQGMKEQYWKRTKGVVRTALEQSIELLEYYNFKPEMGHKEVGGVKAHIKDSGSLTHIMEQLEIDWKFSTALQAADNELFARIFIKEIFRLHGLEATFMAKPVEGVAGSGEHIHVNAIARLKNGRKINLFSPENYEKDFLNSIGWGALMGIMKNYSVLAPFITASNDGFNRLKPGFEAPTHPVASLGRDVSSPSRNRTVLLGLIRNPLSPLSTRFEIRSPNPHTNVYVSLSAVYQCAIDGIIYALSENRTPETLEREFCKSYGEEADYLEKNRVYRTEEDIFKHYTMEERDRLFGTPPATVYETLMNLFNNPEGIELLTKYGVFTDKILESYSKAMRRIWKMELSERILYKNLETVRACVPIHDIKGHENMIDKMRWDEIELIKNKLGKDTIKDKCIFTRIRESIDERNYEKVSDLQKEIRQLMSDLETKYFEYRQNIL